MSNDRRRAQYVAPSTISIEIVNRFVLWVHFCWYCDSFSTSQESFAQSHFQTHKRICKFLSSLNVGDTILVPPEVSVANESERPVSAEIVILQSDLQSQIRQLQSCNTVHSQASQMDLSSCSSLGMLIFYLFTEYLNEHPNTSTIMTLSKKHSPRVSICVSVAT
jgi:hypothetical protein